MRKKAKWTIEHHQNVQKNILFKVFNEINTLVKLKDIIFLKPDENELGYTTPNREIYLTWENDRYMDDLSRKDKNFFRKGIFVHEALHQRFSDFWADKEMLNSIDDYKEKHYYHLFFNLLEDPAIEFMGWKVVPKKHMKALRYMISLVYKKSRPLNESETALTQLINALVMFGDMGILKGFFTFPEARECFKNIIPLFAQGIEEPNGEKRILLAKEITEIARPLWENCQDEVGMPEGKSEISSNQSSKSKKKSQQGTSTMGQKPSKQMEKASEARKRIVEAAKKEAENNSNSASKEKESRAENSSKNETNSNSMNESSKAEEAVNNSSSSNNQKSNSGNPSDESTEGNAGDDSKDEGTNTSSDNQSESDSDFNTEGSKSESSSSDKGETDANEAPSENSGSTNPSEVNTDEGTDDTSDSQSESDSGSNAEGSKSDSNSSDKGETDANEAPSENSNFTDSSEENTGEGADNTADNQSESDSGSNAEGSKSDSSSSDKVETDANEASSENSGSTNPSEVNTDEGTDDTADNQSESDSGSNAEGSKSDSSSSDKGETDANEASSECSGSKDSSEENTGEGSNGSSYSQCTSDNGLNENGVESDCDSPSIPSDDPFTCSQEEAEEACSESIGELESDSTDFDNETDISEQEYEKQVIERPELDSAEAWEECLKGRKFNSREELIVPGQSDQKVYDSLKKELYPEIHRLEKVFDKIFKQDADQVLKRQSGKVNIMRAAKRTSVNIFDKKKEAENIDDLAIEVLIDLSGSMGYAMRKGNRNIDYARASAIMLAEACATMKIPCRVVGHCTDFYDPNIASVHKQYTSFNNYKAERYALASIEAQNECNMDGMAIRYATACLKKINAEHKILILFSDGLPYSPEYDTYTSDSGQFDTQLAAKQVRKVADFISIGIGDVDEENFFRIYGKDFIRVKNAKDLPHVLSKRLLKLLKKYAA